jgi:hypothetical protein
LIAKGYPPFLIRTENLKHRWSFRLMLSLGKLNFPSDALEWSEKELDLFVGPALSKVRTGMVLAVAELSQWCRCDWRYAQNLKNHRKPTVISLGGVRHALHFPSCTLVFWASHDLTCVFILRLLLLQVQHRAMEVACNVETGRFPLFLPKFLNLYLDWLIC